MKRRLVRAARGRGMAAPFWCALALAFTAAPALGYGGGVQDPSLWHPMREPVTIFGEHIDTLYWGIFWLTGAIFVAVQVVLLYFVIRYRATLGGKAKFIHGNNRLEAAWTIAPSVILVLIAALSKATWDEIRVDIPDDDRVARIECIAQQFEWFFRYPGNDGEFGPRNTTALAEARAEGNTSDPWQIDLEAAPAGWTGETPPGVDDVVETDTFRVPADRPVRILLTSNDVLHSFYVPEFRVKHDAVPGMNGGRIWFELPSDRLKGQRVYDLICAELCGLNHYSMNGKLIVLPTGPVAPEVEAMSGEDLLAQRDEQGDEEFKAWLDGFTYETYVYAMSKIAAAENAGSDDGY